MVDHWDVLLDPIWLAVFRGMQTGLPGLFRRPVARAIDFAVFFLRAGCRYVAARSGDQRLRDQECLGPPLSKESAYDLQGLFQDVGGHHFVHQADLVGLLCIDSFRRQKIAACLTRADGGDRRRARSPPAPGLSALPSRRTWLAPRRWRCRSRLPGPRRRRRPRLAPSTMVGLRRVLSVSISSASFMASSMFSASPYFAMERIQFRSPPAKKVARAGAAVLPRGRLVAVDLFELCGHVRDHGVVEGVVFLRPVECAAWRRRGNRRG